MAAHLKPHPSEDRYVPVREAVSFVDYTQSYIARLAREGKVDARKVDGTWHVDIDSLKEFELTARAEKERMQEAIRLQRLEEQKSLHSKKYPAAPALVAVPSALPALARSLVVFAFMVMVGGMAAYAVEHRDRVLATYGTVLHVAANLGTNPAAVIESVGNGVCSYSDTFRLIRKFGVCTDNTTDRSFFVNVKGPAIGTIVWERSGGTQQAAAPFAATNIAYVTNREFRERVNTVNNIFSALNPVLATLVQQASTYADMQRDMSALEEELNRIGRRTSRQSEEDREDFSDAINAVTHNTTLTGTLSLPDLAGGILTVASDGTVSTTTGGDTSYWTQSGTSIYYTTGNVGIGTTTPANALTVAGNIGLASGGYLSFGSATSSAGYGFRDNSGTIQYKNNGGVWTNISTGGGGATTFAGLTDTPANYSGAAGQWLAVNAAGDAVEFVSTSTLRLTESQITDLGSYVENLSSFDTDDLAEGTNLYYTDARARAALSSTATGLTYTSGTGVFSLTSGYTIPLTASTTEWATAYGWGDHSTQGYLTTVDISDDTNLAVGSGVTLTGDTLTVTAAGGLAQTASGLTTTGILEDLNTLGAATADGQFLVATGAGTFAYESTSTARTSLGLGTLATQNSVDISDETNLAVSATGLELSGDAIALSAGYTIPLTASTTNWNTFYDTPSNRITAGTNLSWSGNTLNVDDNLANYDNSSTNFIDLTDLSSTATGLTYTNTTGVFSLTSGYTIPLTASTTEWATAYSWGDHSTQGYLTDITGESVEDLSDVASMTQSSGDLLYWTGSSWSNIATSTLGLVADDCTDCLNETEIEDIYVLNTGDSIAGDFTPGTTNTYELGTSALRWDDVYVDGSLRVGAAADESIIAYSTASNKLTFQNTDDSTSAFQFLDFSGSPVVNIDTSNGRLGIGDASPSAALTVGSGDLFQVNSSGAIAAATGITSSGTITLSGLTNGLLFANGSGVLSASSTIASSLIEDAYLRNDGDTGVGTYDITGTLGVTGTTTLATSGGNVGIGTSDPGALLHLWGPGTLGAGSSLYFGDIGEVANPHIRERGAGDSDQLDISGKMGIYLKTGSGSGTDRMVINSSGDVGIGTTTPDSRLTISAIASQLKILESDNADKAWHMEVDNSNFMLVESGVAVPLTVEAGASYDSVYIDSSGSVGIGDSTPDHKFDVAGNIGLSASGYINWGDTTGSSGYGFRDNAGTLEFKNSAGSWAAIGSGGSSVWTETGSDIYYTTGSVGIGDSTPSYLLTVGDGDQFGISTDGSTLTFNYNLPTMNLIANNATSSWVIATSSSGNPFLSIDTTTGSEEVTVGVGGGDVYIGAVGSASDLVFEESSTIHGQGGNTLTFGTAGDILNFGVNVHMATSSYLNFGYSDGVGGYGIRDNNGTIEFKHLSGSWGALDGVFNSTSTSGYFNDAGNIAIGTSTVSGARLTVQATSTNDIFALFKTAGENALTVASDGKVGIGTTTPDKRLTVLETVADAQFSLAYDATRYGTFQIDSAGDLTITTTGNDVIIADDNLQVCESGSCPDITASSTAGYAIVENGIYFGNGMKIDQVAGTTTEIAVYNASGTPIVIFDH